MKSTSSVNAAATPSHRPRAQASTTVRGMDRTAASSASIGAAGVLVALTRLGEDDAERQCAQTVDDLAAARSLCRRVWNPSNDCAAMSPASPGAQLGSTAATGARSGRHTRAMSATLPLSISIIDYLDNEILRSYEELEQCRPTARPRRALAGLDSELRWMSTYSVLFSHLVAARAGLTSTDLEALDILLLTGPIPVGRLSGWPVLSSGAVTSLVDRLEAVGGARREPDPDDRRRWSSGASRCPNRLAQIIRPAFTAVGRAMDDLFARYSDDLALIWTSPPLPTR